MSPPRKFLEVIQKFLMQYIVQLVVHSEPQSIESCTVTVLDSCI